MGTTSPSVSTTQISKNCCAGLGVGSLLRCAGGGTHTYGDCDGVSVFDADSLVMKGTLPGNELLQDRIGLLETDGVRHLWIFPDYPYNSGNAQLLVYDLDEMRIIHQSQVFPGRPWVTHGVFRLREHIGAFLLRFPANPLSSKGLSGNFCLWDLASRCLVTSEFIPVGCASFGLGADVCALGWRDGVVCSGLMESFVDSTFCEYDIFTAKVRAKFRKRIIDDRFRREMFGCLCSHENRRVLFAGGDQRTILTYDPRVGEEHVQETREMCSESLAMMKVVLPEFDQMFISDGSFVTVLDHRFPNEKISTFRIHPSATGTRVLGGGGKIVITQVGDSQFVSSNGGGMVRFDVRSGKVLRRVELGAQARGTSDLCCPEWDFDLVVAAERSMEREGAGIGERNRLILKLAEKHSLNLFALICVAGNAELVRCSFGILVANSFWT